jgi:hypothetical protein
MMERTRKVSDMEEKKDEEKEGEGERRWQGKGRNVTQLRLYPLIYM